jgi:hypothetical protein
MADFYGNLQSVASGVLAQFKQGVIQYVAETPGAGPAHNPGSPTTVTTTLPGAVAIGVEKRYEAQALIVGAEKQVTSSVVAGIDPKNGDKITIDGVAFRIVEVIKIPAAGTAVVWKFLIRK